MKSQKKPLFILFLSVLCIGAMLSGCASAAPTQSFDSATEEAYPDRIEKTVIGMDFEEFKTIWPEATKVGIGEIFEFICFKWAIPGKLYSYKAHTKFYFSNDKLVKYESYRTYK
jgi:hypothetical protein